MLSTIFVYAAAGMCCVFTGVLTLEFIRAAWRQMRGWPTGRRWRGATILLIVSPVVVLFSATRVGSILIEWGYATLRLLGAGAVRLFLPSVQFKGKKPRGKSDDER